MLFRVRIDRNQPQYMYFISTEVDKNTPWRQVSSGTHMVHQQTHKPSGKNQLERDFQISKHFCNTNNYRYIVYIRKLGTSMNSLTYHNYI